VEVTEKSKRMLCFGASGCILVVYGECVTLVTAKSAKSLLRVRARVRVVVFTVDNIWEWAIGVYPTQKGDAAKTSFATPPFVLE